ncbi:MULTISPECIES: 6-phosphogluconolactonase [Thiorhodovibrio]|uniref:6-phosphogluconolactonase n=1 Tax=Thiorhodovibrio TaxID=61593 RepID=UPI001912C17A|nr:MULTISPECIES: 6-phosphogluconolactonase [Thiorhodovibrio]MBK5968566.1 6-phosphogluconolactonase [Thiorhodovibrio winogradskyi]WPL11337.1 6-phosphogluconolactonase [Thiorhodovibrio litoralis]
MQLPGVETQVFEDAKAVAEAAAERIMQLGRAAVAERGWFNLVLAGGTTPEAAYRLLAQTHQDWSGWRFFVGDERCLPVDDPQRNSRMALNSWLEPAGIHPSQLAAIPAELGPEAAASAYAPVVAEALPFDLVLLGMGEDGHTASLFPGLASDRELSGPDLVVPVRDAPKPPPDRVSLTAGALGACRQMLLLVTGAGKHHALEQWQQGAALPVARVAAAGSALIMLDQSAETGA